MRGQVVERVEVGVERHYGDVYHLAGDSTGVLLKRHRFGRIDSKVQVGTGGVASVSREADDLPC